MDNTILISILSMAGLGLFFALVLAFANQKLKVKEDPRVEKIFSVLPGVNCGACGYTSCHQYAEALAAGNIGPDQCRAGGESVTKKLCDILGVEAGESVKEIAVIHCGADASKRKKKAIYNGIHTCRAAHNTFGAESVCEYGCLGYGDCMRACPFGAITMVNGLPRIDKNKCTACKKCTVACPRGIITVERLHRPDLAYVACSNRQKGAETRKICSVGCIACGLCQKETSGIFYVENNLAQVRYEKEAEIKDINALKTRCPAKCILNV